MDERRKRGARRTPTGRDKRGSRSERTSADDRKPPRIVNRRKASHDERPERTILGLSTGRAIILAVVVCALALTLAVPLRTYFGQRAEAAQVEADRIQLEQDLAALREKRDQQQDPAYIRAEARDRLRLVMPGETPFQVQLPGAYEAEQARRAKPEPPTGPWYSQLWASISKPQPAPTGPAG